MFFWEDWYTYAIVGVVALIVLIAFFRNYVKVPPNVALIVSGRRHKYKVKDDRPGRGQGIPLPHRPRRGDVHHSLL